MKNIPIDLNYERLIINLKYVLLCYSYITKKYICVWVCVFVAVSN